MEIEDSEAKRIAFEHWTYVEGVLRAARMPEIHIKQIQYHYLTAFIHGWKHALEKDGE